MSTEKTTQVLDTTLDIAGVSIVTATKTADSPRLGSVYNPLTLAAAIPVYFHPLADGRYAMVMTARWHSATIGDGGPQSYSDHTESSVPSVSIINPTTGAASTPVDLPTNLSGTREIWGACSHGSAYLFTVGTLDGVAHLAHYRVTADSGALILQGEELIEPKGESGVVFSAGVYIDGDYLVALGVDADDLVYRARKNWGRIGINNDKAWQWSYQGNKGWFAESDELLPLSGITATGGVISYASLRDREYLCALSSAGTATIYSSRRVETGWHTEDTIDGDWVWLQPSLHHNPAQLPVGHNTAIPYVATTHDVTIDAESLQVAWGLHGV